MNAASKPEEHGGYKLALLPSALSPSCSSWPLESVTAPPYLLTASVTGKCSILEGEAMPCASVSGLPVKGPSPALAWSRPKHCSWGLERPCGANCTEGLCCSPGSIHHQAHPSLLSLSWSDL